MTGLVTLRDVTGSDLPVLYAQQLDPAATEMAAFPSRGEAAFMAHWKQILTDDAVDKQVILIDKQVAGNILSFERAGAREVGYWIGSEFWGMGVATRGLAKFLEQVEIRPLYAHVARQNVGSARVLEKCGFSVCGSQVGDDGIEELIYRIQ